MALTKSFVTEKGAAFYRTRMLSPGDSITLNGPSSRLGLALGYLTKEAPAKAPILTVEEALTAEVVEDKPAPKPKAAPRKRTRKPAAKK